MSKADICRTIAGVMVLLVGLAVAFGGVQLWRTPQNWPDIIADEHSVKRTGGGMMAMAALLLVAAVATIAGVSWGSPAAAAAIVALVAAAFWVNHLLFGNMRLSHTLTNVVVAAIILALLWVGYTRPTD